MLLFWKMAKPHMLYKKRKYNWLAWLSVYLDDQYFLKFKHTFTIHLMKMEIITSGYILHPIPGMAFRVSFSPLNIHTLTLLPQSFQFLLILFSMKAWPWSYSVVLFLESLLSWTELILMHVSDWWRLVLTSVSRSWPLKLNANPQRFDLFPLQQLRSLMVTWIGSISHAIAKATSHF